MPRARSAKADEALALYKQGLKLVEIAKRLGVPEGTVRRWKCTHHWDGKQNERSGKNKPNVRKRKRGGQPGNHNASGPPKNKHAEKYGFFTKYLPDETLEIITSTAEADPLDLLWNNIRFQYAAILRAQKIAYVKDQQDKTIEKVEEKDGNIVGERWEVQEAWDKQASFMKAQSIAMNTLKSMIRQYTDMLTERSELATEEQRLRVDLLRSQIRSGSDMVQRVRIVNDTDGKDSSDK